MIVYKTEQRTKAETANTFSINSTLTLQQAQEKRK